MRRTSALFVNLTSSAPVRVQRSCATIMSNRLDRPILVVAAEVASSSIWPVDGKSEEELSVPLPAAGHDQLALAA
jgi:hypothetical protein